MPSRVVAASPRYGRRVMERRVNGAGRVSLAPLVSRSTRIVLSAHPDAAEEEELLLLGAIRELKIQHDRVDLEYVTKSADVSTILKGNWFIRKVHLLASEADYRLAFDDVVGNDYGLFVFEPDPETALIAEESNYKSLYDADVAEKTRIWESYQERGMKDIVKEEPPYNFNPQWHKSNGYLWSLADKLGLQITVPFRAIDPYGDVPAKLARSVQSLAAKDHLTDAPFAVFDCRHEQDEVVLAGVLGKTLDPIKLVSVQALEKSVGGSLTSLLAVLSHKNCEYAIGPVGTFLCAAWAAGVPNILNLYSGSNYRWDGVMGYNCFPLPRDQYTEEQLPSAIYQALMLLRERMKTNHG